MLTAAGAVAWRLANTKVAARMKCAAMFDCWFKSRGQTRSRADLGVGRKTLCGKVVQYATTNSRARSRPRRRDGVGATGSIDTWSKDTRHTTCSRDAARSDAARRVHSSAPMVILTALIACAIVMPSRRVGDIMGDGAAARRRHPVATTPTVVERRRRCTLTTRAAVARRFLR